MLLGARRWQREEENSQKDDKPKRRRKPRDISQNPADDKQYNFTESPVKDNETPISCYPKEMRFHIGQCPAIRKTGLYPR